MVGLYLRGLLKPKLFNGIRSILSENIVMEHLMCDTMAESFLSVNEISMAMLPKLNEKGVRKTIEHTGARHKRAFELKELNLYDVEEQIRFNLKGKSKESELSLFQLYRIAESQGIFDAFGKFYSDEKAKPLF